MINNELIINALKNQEMSLDLLSEFLDIDKHDLMPTIEELIENKQIKFNKSKNVFSLYKGRKFTSKEDILNILADSIFETTYSLSKITKAKIQELKPILNELVIDKKIGFYSDYDVYSILKPAKIIMKDQGYAFASVEGEDKDYYIAPENLMDAYNSDICLIHAIAYDGRSVEAKVSSVVERGHKFLIGKVKLENKRMNSKIQIVSTMNDFNITVEVPFNKENMEYIGSIVIADLEYKKNFITAKIRDKVGHPDDPGIDISQIALEYGFNLTFPDSVVDEIKDIEDYVLESQKKDRKDFTNLNIITIDGDDSKDFDDAVYLEKLSNGNYSLGVFIADVAEYVNEDSPLDCEALTRGTSVYLADRVIPMLPRKLSNGICSLNEGVDRLVLACIMEFDTKGRLVNYDISEGVINSHHRMTYNKVNKILNGDENLINEYSDIYQILINMHELSKILRGLRHKKGGIEFDTAEYKFELNTDGSPKSIIKRERADAEMLIEDFMLAANETIAYHMNIMNLPIVYRIHEKPDQEKLHHVFSNIASMNVSVKNIQNDIHPKQIQSLLESVKDNPNYDIINNMLLRSMMKAKYSSLCLGHYGLAMNYYCHFTSPIRRYPDLMTHRMIKKLLLHPNDLEGDIIRYKHLIEEISLKNSISERKAVDCERAVNDMLYAWYMSSHLFEAFEGTISSITAFGMFITLPNGVEGLVAYRNMRGYFYYNENMMQASDGNKTYHLGDKVKIVVTYSNKETRKIDFMLEEDYKKGDNYENYLY